MDSWKLNDRCGLKSHKIFLEKLYLCTCTCTHMTHTYTQHSYMAYSFGSLWIQNLFMDFEPWKESLWQNSLHNILQAKEFAPIEHFKMGMNCGKFGSSQILFYGMTSLIFQNCVHVSKDDNRIQLLYLSFPHYWKESLLKKMSLREKDFRGT